MDPLVSTEWLADDLGKRGFSILDATLLAADTGRDARAEYDAGHIPGARFLDLARLRDTGSPLPNMLPPVEQTASRMRALGVGDGDRVVLYDDSPWHTAARAWFLLQHLRHRQCRDPRWRHREVARGGPRAGDRRHAAARPPLDRRSPTLPASATSRR